MVSVPASSKVHVRLSPQVPSAMMVPGVGVSPLSAIVTVTLLQPGEVMSSSPSAPTANLIS